MAAGIGVPSMQAVMTNPADITVAVSPEARVNSDAEDYGMA